MDDISADESSTDESGSGMRVTQKGKRVNEHQVMNPQESAVAGGGPAPRTSMATKNVKERMEYDEHERYELRRLIALALSSRPYASHYMIMDFVPRAPSSDLQALKYMDIAH